MVMLTCYVFQQIGKNQNGSISTQSRYRHVLYNKISNLKFE